jgi:heavy metal sensor kinase
MKRINSIRVRFALWSTLLLLGMLTAFGGFVYVYLSYSLHTAIDNTLSLSAEQTAAGLNIDNGQINITEPIAGNETGSEAYTTGGLTLIVLSKDGTVLQATGPFRAYPTAIQPTGSQGVFQTLTETNQSIPIRAYVLPVLDDTSVVGWVQALQSLATVNDSLQRLLTTLLLGGGVLSLLAGFVGYFLAAHALAPIDHITNAARRISTADLSSRLSLPDTGDEVSRLAGTFNEMLDRLETGFRRERQFTSDASHELRTPLAAMQAILSVMREGDRPVAEYRQALDDLAGETDRLRGLVEDLLRLARGELHHAEESELVDLSTLLIDVTDSLRPLAEEKGLSLSCDAPPGMTLNGNRDTLIRLFVNLLDNAIKFTEHGQVTVTGKFEKDFADVKIADTGAGIAPEHLAHIFDRFYRVESARSSAGSGLGLSITQQIAEEHGGSIKVESTLNEGTEFTVRIPLMKKSKL